MGPLFYFTFNHSSFYPYLLLPVLTFNRTYFLTLQYLLLTLYLLFEILPDLLVGYLPICRGQSQRILNIHELIAHAHPAHHVIVAPLEVVAHHHRVLHRLHLLLDLAVRVVDDRQEHIQQDKEHKEEVSHKEDRAEDPVRGLQ